MGDEGIVGRTAAGRHRQRDSGAGNLQRGRSARTKRHATPARGPRRYQLRRPAGRNAGATRNEQPGGHPVAQERAGQPAALPGVGNEDPRRRHSEQRMGGAAPASSPRVGEPLHGPIPEAGDRHQVGGVLRTGCPQAMRTSVRDARSRRLREQCGVRATRLEQRHSWLLVRTGSDPPRRTGPEARPCRKLAEGRHATVPAPATQERRRPALNAEHWH
jgi:hypothetical protein